MSLKKENHYVTLYLRRKLVFDSKRLMLSQGLGTNKCGICLVKIEIDLGLYFQLDFHLDRSPVWEQLNLGREYRPYSVRSVLAIPVKDCSIQTSCEAYNN